jgi:hypothetical protein
MAGCDTPMVTVNYGVETTPRKEYEITVGTRPCPDKDLLDKLGKRVRVIKSIEGLKKLPLVGKAGLIEGEVVSVVSPRRHLAPRCVTPLIFCRRRPLSCRFGPLTRGLISYPGSP